VYRGYGASELFVKIKILIVLKLKIFLVLLHWKIPVCVTAIDSIKTLNTSIQNFNTILPFKMKSLQKLFKWVSKNREISHYCPKILL
jgi:hypothetical protein